MMSKIILFLILGVDVVILFFQAQQLSISSAESYILFEEHSYISYIYRFLFEFFGVNDYTLRLPLIALHVTNSLLLYNLSTYYLHKERDRLWLILLYVMLPGAMSSAIVLSHASFVLFGLLLFCFVQKHYGSRYANIFLLFFSFIDGGFGFLFLGLLLYALAKKQYAEAVYYSILLGISGYLYRLSIHSGIPSGHFLDSIGVYSAVFTPIIFIYIIYALYRKYLAKEQDKLWYVATAAFVFSILLSFRQRLDLEYFAPYLILALPLAAQIFARSYRVRLREFRKKYKMIFVLSFVFLSLNTLLVIFNKYLYVVLDNPKKHFAYNMHVAKELAQVLKEKGIRCVNTDSRMQKRLHFYGIGECSQNFLNETLPSSEQNTTVTIRYKQKPVYKANVTKIYTK